MVIKVSTAMQHQQRTNNIQHFDENLLTSIQRAAYKLGILTTAVWRTLAGDGCYPYHIQCVQHLLPPDTRKRCYGWIRSYSPDRAYLKGD